MSNKRLKQGFEFDEVLNYNLKFLHDKTMSKINFLKVKFWCQISNR